MDRAFSEMWERIVAHEGAVFVLKRGDVFTYQVRRKHIVPSTTNYPLHISQFEKAWRRMPVDGPGGLQDLRGPSYLWAILSDPRIASHQ